MIQAPSFEIRDSKLLSMFRNKPVPKRTAAPYIPLTTPKSQIRSYRSPKQKDHSSDVTRHYPLSRIRLNSASNRVTTQIPPHGPIFPFPRPG